MFSWGEAKMGQLGLGRYRDVRTPKQIEFPEPQTVIKSCSAGWGHTVALTDMGKLYSWGFNVFGQVGKGDTAPYWKPVHVSHDDQGEELQPIIKVACSNYATYAIDQTGAPLSWGKGFIGFAGETRSKKPKRIEQNTENRVFTDVFTNGDSALLFAPVRVY